MSEQISFVIEQYDNKTLAEANEQFALMIVQLKAENDKLRELAQDMFGGYKGAVEMLPSSYSKNVAEMAVKDISDRMRELEIEVDQ